MSPPPHLRYFSSVWDGDLNEYECLFQWYLCVLVSVCECERDSFFFLSFFIFFLFGLVWFSLAWSFFFGR